MKGLYYAYDVKLKRRCVHIKRGDYYISLATGERFKESPPVNGVDFKGGKRK